jgi:quercetin dioxygenase-like cupin family protein
MKYVHVYNDEDGRTRLEDRETSFEIARFAPPAPPLDVSTAEIVSELMFIRFPAGWTDPAHPAPARQWMLALSGQGESTVGDETRVWGPGDVLFLEDISGPGHRTSVIKDTIMAGVRC